MQVTTIFTVEGNIGSGKSTLIDYIQNNLNVSVLPEPIHVWNNLKSSYPSIIEAVYNEPSKYSYDFQLHVILTFTNMLMEMIKKNPNCIVTERSLWAFNNVFSRMLHKNKTLTSNQCFVIENITKTLALLFKDYKVLTIYIDTPPEICIDRISMRNRPGEEKISLEYLQSIHEYHNVLYSTDAYIHKTNEETIRFIRDQTSQRKSKSLLSSCIVL